MTGRRYENAGQRRDRGRLAEAASAGRSTSRAAGSTPATSSSSRTRPPTPSRCCSRPQRALGAAAPADARAEARFGLRWLDKAWDQRSGRARTPGRDRLGQPGRHVQRRPRPLAPARGGRRAHGHGEPLPAPPPGVPRQRPGSTVPPNLAGRVAAAFALGGAARRARATPRGRARELGDGRGDLRRRARRADVQPKRRRHRAPARLLPRVVLARRPGARRRPSWRSPARRSATRARPAG